MPMSVTEAVETRRSVRAFLPDAIDTDLISRLIVKATRAPSGGNLQPWHVVMIAGEPLAALKREMAEAQRFEAPEYEVYPANLPEPYRTRRFAVGEEMYRLVGIPRDDKAGRLAWLARNFQFFGAPLGLFIHTPRYMGPPQWSDLGMMLQTLMLLLREAGLDSCPQEAWAMFPETVRRHVEIPADHLLFCGLAIGKADPAAPVNQLRSERASALEFLSCVGTPE